MQLNRYLALCGIASRRKANQVIQAGRVQVNSQIVTELGVTVDPDEDSIRVDGDLVIPVRVYQYVLLNKPKDVLCSVTDDRGRTTVCDLIPHETRLFPVGRLDMDTVGALLLTNDGELANRLTHPRYEIDKIYQACVRGRISEQAITMLNQGVELEDGLAKGEARILEIRENESLVSLQLHEGRKRQVKRMLKAVAFPVISLERVNFAGLNTAGLKRGKWRYLIENEVSQLYALTGLDQKVDDLNRVKHV